MKKLTMIAGLLLATTLSYAQVDPDDSYVGIKAAMNFSSNTFKDPSLENTDVFFTTGFAAGFYGNIAVAEKMSIQAELMFSEMGSDLDEDINGEAQTTKIRLQYYSMPLVFKYMVMPKLGVFLGPQFDFLYNAKSEFSDAGSSEELDKYDSYDFAATLGAEYWFKPGIGVYARYMQGLRNINENNGGIPLSYSYITSDTYNMAFQFGVTIAFRSKSETTSAAPVPVAPIPSPAPKPADSDGDGIADASDKCPTLKGTAQYQGCPDTDGDGVADDTDRCPKTAGITGNMGCPELIVYFQREEAGLTDDDKKNLDIVVNFMNNHPDLNVVVEGHTSTPGEEAFNMTLSVQRANEAIDYMVSKGVPKSRFIAKGFGEQFPIGDNSTEEGRSKSRRVVMRIAQ